MEYSRFLPKNSELTDRIFKAISRLIPGQKAQKQQSTLLGSDFVTI
jgi:hypothetical protein